MAAVEDLERSRGKAAVAPPPGAVAGDGSAVCPASHPIKGNASSMIYHEPDKVSYLRTIPEFCFDSREFELSGV